METTEEGVNVSQLPGSSGLFLWDSPMGLFPMGKSIKTETLSVHLLGNIAGSIELFPKP